MIEIQFDNDSNINAKSYNKSDKSMKKQKISRTDVPANYQVAMRHRQVFNLHQIPQDYKGQWQCECCGRYSKPYSVHMRTSTDFLSYLGTSYPLYFDFLKMSFLFLLAVLFVSGIYSLTLNNNQNICISQKGVDQIAESYYLSLQNNQSPVKIQINCQKNWITKFALGNRGNDKNSLFIQDILNLITVMGLILIIHYIVKRQKEKQIKLDNYFQQPNSFTVLVSNIPIEFTDGKNYEIELIDYIENKMNLVDIHDQKIDMKGSIQKITFCFNIDELIQLEQEVKDLKKKKMKEINTNGLGSDEVYQTEQQIQITEKKIETLRQDLSSKRTKDFMPKYFCGQAFITFKYQHIAFQFLETVSRYKSFFSKQKFYFQGEKLTFKEAPIPDDIEWSDMYQASQKCKIFTFFLDNYLHFLVVIAGLVSYVIITIYSYLGITNHNRNYASYDDVVSSHLTAVGLAIIMQALNIYFYILVKICLRMLNFNSKTSRLNMTTSITIILQFIINNVMPFAILSSQMNNQSLYSMLYNPTGLSILQTYNFFLQAVTPVILCVIDIPYLIKCFYRDRAHLTKRSQYINQEELGKIFEDPEFDLGYHYCTIIRVIYQTMFYAPMIPMCLIWSLGSIIIYYIVTKFQLIYRRAVIDDIGPEISFSILHHLPISLIIFSISTYCFHRINDPQQLQKLIPSIISIIISSANYLFIPLFRSNAKIFELDIDSLTFFNLNRPYEDIQSQFKTEYDKLNPAMNTNLLEKYNKNENYANLNEKSKQYAQGKSFVQSSTPKSFQNQMDFQSNSNNLNLKLINSKKSSFLDLKMIERSSNQGNDQFYQSQGYASQNKSNKSSNQQIQMQNKYLQQSQLTIDKMIQNQQNSKQQISGNAQDLIPIVQKQLSIIKQTPQYDSQFVNKQIVNNKWLLDQIREYQSNYHRNRQRQANQSDFLLVSQLKAQLEQSQQILTQQAKILNNAKQ
ncbi:transmembrane protein, putative (macronuclear) [Tetrahymena thermophila SB210]|uniref:Transmembrane protein, putative n=1 Tax=Tetrahymena thermophila (strain SB210) TaxID=312017 RepID=I7M2F4_TETTS|nr:transmembrane protein, putative [Tetrahymena thermophila SB210]EAS00286.2 transmembrane protein, putative [Tetrahymena thermophila SB210]|eukprot:XP_001020531.2 transmembrane protein, putative [Tetrahymena thermophila SB210]